MRTFILNLQFLTTIPINTKMKVEDNDFPKGLVYFPIIGLLIGFINFAAYYIAAVFFDGVFPLVFSLLINTVITGAIHIDGLADTCDGILSSRKKDRMLEIMKDSRIGTNGTIAIVFDYLLRLSILSTMDGRILFLAILLSPVVSRTIMVILIKISTSSRTEGVGLGGLYLGKQTTSNTLITCILSFVIIYGFMGLYGVLGLVLCIILGLLYRWFIYKKIDGMTGDTIGASNEVIEIAFLIIMILLGRIL